MQAWLAATSSVIAGGLLTISSSWLADKRLMERERERRREENSERRIIRRADFQRDTLLALQDASQGLLRATGAMHMQDVATFRKTRQWQRQQFAESLSKDHLRYMTDTMLLSSRVNDEQTREIAEQLRACSATVGFSENEAEAESRMTQAGLLQGQLIERTGQLIRDLDEAE